MTESNGNLPPGINIQWGKFPFTHKVLFIGRSYD